jgi:type II pantothenate kinase
LLADPASYVACDWNLSEDHEARAYWVGFFKRHLETILKLGTDAAVARGAAREECARRAAACREEFVAHFDGYLVDPAKAGCVSILTLDAWRDDLLRKHEFGDAFVDLKDRENAAALPLLSRVCRQIDELADRRAEQLRAIIEGVFAGNIFDMGAEATAKRFLNESPDFFETRKKLPARPWLIDDYDDLVRRMLAGSFPCRKCIFFVDNAGGDFVLGTVPMIRFLARRGCEVVIAANEWPTLNDMTVHDVRRWWPRMIEAEPSLASLPISIVSTGTGEPLIDLSKVSPELNHAARGADLVVLEGMGRGVESNLNAAFSCDALNLAMLKDAAVAARVGGKVYDVVCSFRRPANG